MTWGANASFKTITCRYCGGAAIDDRDEGLSSHEEDCDRRPMNLLLDLGGFRHSSKGGALHKPAPNACDKRTPHIFRAALIGLAVLGLLALTLTT